MFKLETIEGKPWHQVGIFGGIALVLCAVVWYFVTSPIRDETVATIAQVDTLKSENALAQATSQRINEFRAAFTRAESDYAELKALLPEQRELTSVLQGLQDRARGRLSVRRFTPKEDVQQDFYFGKPMEVEISGSYNNLGAFFADMAAYQRIVSISDFSVSRNAEQGGGRTIDAQFLLTAYYVSAEKLDVSPVKPDATKPGAKKPAAPVAAAAVASNTGNDVAKANF